MYTKTDLVFGFTRPRQNEYRAGGRLTGRAGWKPNLGEGILGQKAPRTFPGQKAPRTFPGQTPRTLLAQFYLGF